MPYDTPNHLVALFACFFAALIVLHLWFVWPRNLTKRQWKYADYVWLFAGLLTLISIGGELRRYHAEQSLELVSGRTQNMHQLFIDFFIEEPPSYVCRTFVRSELSPDDIDEVQAKFDELCEWFRTFPSVFLSETLPDFHPIEWQELSPPSTDEASLADILLGMEKQLSYFNDSARELRAVREDLEETFVESLFRQAWPFLFVFAVALRMAKTTGELRHER